MLSGGERRRELTDLFGPRPEPTEPRKPARSGPGPLRRFARSVRNGLRGLRAFLTPAPWSLTSLALNMALVAGLGGVAFILPDTSRMRGIEHAGLPYNAVFFDAEGNRIGSRGGRFAPDVAVEDLPPHLLNALLATEDHRFFEHWGVDMRGIARAAQVNAEAGAIVQGGSTITQQLAKNLFLSPERTITRKLKEALVAFWLEYHYSKDELLLLYVNRVYLGAGTFGVEAASQHYFGKSARDVNLAEAALLAGLPQAPSRYAPTVNIQRAHDRARTVLNRMVVMGTTTPGEAEAARQNPAGIFIEPNDPVQQYFVDYVYSQLPHYLGEDVRTVMVETTMDPALQADLTRLLQQTVERKGEELTVDQGAIVLMTPTGEIRALIGGREYTESQFNRASQAKRQPGSTFKPFVYLAALQNGFTPTTLVRDGRIRVGNWRPKNYSRRYYGYMTMANSLRWSINTVPVKIAEEIGREQVIETAQSLGIDSQLAPNPSLPLGTSEVTLVELTGAYAAFANGGARATPTGIARVADREGKTLLEVETGGPLVMSEQQAADMNAMLRRVVRSGTGRRARFGRSDAGGKTGTTQQHRDAWFVGFTNNYVAGVWLGNDDSSPTNKITGGELPARLWRKVMRRAHYGVPVRSVPTRPVPTGPSVSPDVPVASAEESVPVTSRTQSLEELNRPAVVRQRADAVVERPDRPVSRGRFRNLWNESEYPGDLRD